MKECMEVTPLLGDAAPLGVFASNGVFHNTDENNPDTRSSIFGNWERAGRYTYRFSY
jgi:hypothetical protein